MRDYQVTSFGIKLFLFIIFSIIGRNGESHICGISKNLMRNSLGSAEGQNPKLLSQRAYGLLYDQCSDTMEIKMTSGSPWFLRSFVILLLPTAAVAQSTLTSADCRRIENKNRCVDFGCDQIRRDFNIQHCTNDWRDWIWDMSRKCQLPTLAKCFQTRPSNNLISNNNDNTQITSANCRRPENYDRCVDFGCEKIRQFHNVICTSKLRKWVWDTAKQCQLPQYEQCFQTRPPNNLIENEALSGAYCRRYENRDRCTDFVCSIVRNRYNRDCSNQMREWIQSTLSICQLPSVELCFNTEPPRNIDYNTNNVISPSICRNNPSSCLPYACDKMHADYGRSCSDQSFENQVWSKLQ